MSTNHSSTSSKVRFDGLDVQAMVSYIQQTCIGRKIINIYDGNSTNSSTSSSSSNSNNNNTETYIFKLDGNGNSSVASASASAGAVTNTTNAGASMNDNTATAATPMTMTDDTNTNSKQFLLIESGIRFHTITNFSSETSKVPTPFCMKLRKHLRNLRIEQIIQIQNEGRVIIIQCGVGYNKHYMILELYSKGNFIITDHNYIVIALLRSHIYNNNNNNTKNDTTQTKGTKETASLNVTSTSSNNNAVVLQVGQVYPVSYATSIGIGIGTGTTITAPSNNNKDGITEETTASESELVVTTNNEKKDLLAIESVSEFNQWVRQYIQTTTDTNMMTSTTGTSSKKKKKSSSSSSGGGGPHITLKVVLSQNNIYNTTNHIINTIHHYGPALIEHCIRMAQLDPNTNLITISKENDTTGGNPTTATASLNIYKYSDTEWYQLRTSLRVEGSKVLHTIQDGTKSTGYILYRPLVVEPQGDEQEACQQQSQQQQQMIVHDAVSMETFDFSNMVLLEFQPLLLEQHRIQCNNKTKNIYYLQFIHFALAVEIYFDNIVQQKNTIKAIQAEKLAMNKLEKVRLDQQERVDQLIQQQSYYEIQAKTIQYHADNVDKAILVINSAIQSGMSWDQIEQIVHIEKMQNLNPIALLIHQLELQNDAMILRLPQLPSSHINNDDDDYNEDEDTNSHEKTIDVRILLNESAYANSNRIFAQYRASKEKSIKTIEASSKALKAAEETAKRQLLEAQKRKGQSGGGGGTNTTIIGKRKVGWYEKFHWFITSDNYLVIGGKDAQQNELLVKRYLRTGDAYLHADIHGASSCILRAKRRRDSTNTRTQIVPLSDQALREAGNFTICHSNAWSNRIITSAWWVEAHQVSKTAPTGEYLTVGSFMVRGKKNYLPPTSPLEMGLGVLFRLGNDESIIRHQNERRDFALLDSFDSNYNVKIEESNDIYTETLKQTDTIEEDIAYVTDDERIDVDRQNETGIVHDHEQSEADEANSDLQMKTEVGNNTNMENDDKYHDEGNIETRHDATKFESSSHDDDINDPDPAAEDLNQNASQKRGYSVRDRKLIKKYGSLEAAEKILASQQVNHVKKLPEETEADDASSIVTSMKSQKEPVTLKRGQKAKLKRIEKKYIDQDEDDRALALLALQGGEREKKKAGKQSKKGKSIVVSETQQKVAAETVALLGKDISSVVQKLRDDVKSILAECITDTISEKDDPSTTVPWEKFDADTLEQLLLLTPIDAQVAAAKRLLSLSVTTRIDNYSASLGGIIRTIRKHGYSHIDGPVDPLVDESSKGNTNQAKNDEKVQKKEALDEIGDIDVDAIDDTVEISKLTGKPHPDDLLLYAIPVCGPYQSLSQYSYRVKLTPGGMKRGKSSKQCLDILLKTPSNAAVGMEKHLDLIKKVTDNEWLQSICGDVKISAPGSSKSTKQAKASTKNSK